MSAWWLYLIECRNGAVYTGITTDVAARYRAHAEGRGAKYTRANPPLRLLAQRRYLNRSLAAKAEQAIKRLPAAEKRKIVETWAADG
jgi:putative endonuclease